MTEVTAEYAALTIVEVEPSDAGDYTVIVENAAGRDERRFIVEVHGKNQSVSSNLGGKADMTKISSLERHFRSVLPTIDYHHEHSN